jgi:DNA-binding response OmpR family regulator
MANPGRILIADDEETFLVSTADLLRKEGYECDCAPDASTAAEMLRSAEYDLLIADIKMPGNPQLEFVQEVPRIAQGIPVILVTGYPSTDSAIQSIQLPVMAYLVKPVDIDKLLEIARTAIKQYRVYRTAHSMRQHLQEWSKEVEDVEEMAKSVTHEVSYSPVDVFIDFSFRNIASALTDVRHLAEAISMDNAEREVCQLLDCPKLATLTDALVETVTILEKTKSSFKSKELGELRRKLEQLIRSGTA